MTDTFGRAVTVPDTVRRIVVLSRDSLELVRALDATDMVVGVSDTVRRDPSFWPELARAAFVGRWNEPDYEAVAALKPDLVLAYGRYPGPEAEEKLARSGVALLRLEIYMLSGFDREVRTLGQALNRQAQAEDLLTWRRDKFAALAACLQDDTKRPLVYMEGFSPLHTFGPGSSGNESLTLAGGGNLAGCMRVQYGEIDPEWVVRGAPEAIVKVSSLKERYDSTSAAAFESQAEELAARPGWSGVEAVRRGRVLVLGSEVQGGPRAPIGVAILARWLHPGACAGIDPEAWHRQYLERFQKRPYRGVWMWSGSRTGVADEAPGEPGADAAPVAATASNRASGDGRDQTQGAGQGVGQDREGSR